MKKEENKTSTKVQKLIDSISELSILELSELVKALEEKFNVRPVAVSMGTGTTPAQNNTGTTPNTTGPVAEAEEKSEFDITLTNAGANKIAVIKVIREFKPELGLKEAKDLVDNVPAEIGTMKKEAANEIKTKLEAAGAQVELK